MRTEDVSLIEGGEIEELEVTGGGEGVAFGIRLVKEPILPNLPDMQVSMMLSSESIRVSIIFVMEL